MWKFLTKLFDMKWIYDTSMSAYDCVNVLKNLPEHTAHLWSSFSCSQTTDTHLELVFRQPKNGDGRPKRTVYIADFFTLENKQTVIVLRFVDELFIPIPFTCIEEIDEFLKNYVDAQRRC